VYGEDLDGSDRLKLVDELRGAIDKGELTLHYQPQMDFRTGGIASAEALLRWVHPERGLIPPMQFIPLAEEAGLMWQVTSFVLDQAAAQAAAWGRSGRAMAVAVNVSATDLLHEGFAEMVRGTVSRNGLEPERLIIEITETCVIHNLAQSRAVVEDLKRSGITISLDDFGAGATSLAHLSNLGVGELKLDRSFVTALSGPDRRKVLDLVNATVKLGHAMGLRVVAEGIEDKATLDLVAELGCDLAQGYYICMPKPASELAFRAHERDAVAELVL
jgi:EAL domain-containing protein (putative c-di-GMP-specific phosphodiesterase class I)